jgi:hypothetical protein
MPTCLSRNGCTRKVQGLSHAGKALPAMALHEHTHRPPWQAAQHQHGVKRPGKADSPGVTVMPPHAVKQLGRHNSSTCKKATADIKLVQCCLKRHAMTKGISGDLKLHSINMASRATLQAALPALLPHSHTILTSSVDEVNSSWRCTQVQVCTC